VLINGFGVFEWGLPDLGSGCLFRLTRWVRKPKKLRSPVRGLKLYV
jgi:hypothetical protein